MSRYYLDRYYLDPLVTPLPDPRAYTAHLAASPGSLLVRILGVYSLLLRHTTVHLIIMQSVFPPAPGNAHVPGHARQLRATYDIKGCLAGRYQSPGTGHIFKDKNFQEEKLDLGQQRDWFIKQVKR